jgi:GDP-4-dehydro-6-deoxy-D-mannose reductase
VRDGIAAAAMMAKAIVFGGAGFVGAHLRRQLSDRYETLLPGRGACDIRDAGAVRDMVRRVAPALVVNLAAVTTVRESFENPKETYSIGFDGVLNLLSVLDGCGFTGRFLQVSSSEVYGHPASDRLPLTEHSPPDPLSPYAVAKVAGEMLCRQWAARARFGIVVARPFTHIGPGQSARFAIANFAQQIAQIVRSGGHGKIDVGALDTTRDLTDVRDTVRAYDLMLHGAPSGGVFNVCSGREVVMRDVLEELVRISACPIEIRQDPGLIRAAEQRRVLGSYAALEAATGWTPVYTLTRTLSDILDVIRDAP